MAKQRSLSARIRASALVTAATGVSVLGAAVLGAAPAAAAPASPATCTSDVGGSGLSAALVAQPNQRISHQTINASGCDIGIYVGAGVSHVTITGVTVTGANFQGILAEDTSYLAVEHSTLTGNGFHTLTTDPTAPPLGGNPNLRSFVTQSFGISLFGVSNSLIARNRVYNNGRGGIGIMDTGPNNPGTITQNTSAPLVPSSYDRVVGNRTWANFNGCGIVLATQNVAGQLSHMLVADNRVIGTGNSATNGPDVGGIVVAADPPSSTVTDVTVWGNRVTNSFEGGIIVNAEAFNASTHNVRVVGNRVAGNNWGHLEAPNTAGIIVNANPQAPVPPNTTAPENVGTVVAFNRAFDQFYGIWSAGNYPPSVFANHIRVTSGGTPIFPAPQVTQRGHGNRGHAHWLKHHHGRHLADHGRHSHR